MNKRVTILVILAVILAAGATLFWISRSSNSQGGELESASLRLQWLHQAQFAGFYVAKAKGFYREEGLDLTINSGGQGLNAATLVAAGSDTFGIWTADQVLLACAKDVPIVPVGTVFDRSLTAFMVRADSEIRTPKDFEGKTVGMYYGFDSETIYLALLGRFDVDRSKIKETALQYDLARFFNGDVDVWPAYVINQPLVARDRGVDVRLLTPDDFGIQYYSDTLIVNRRTLAERPELVRRFIRASARGWRYALEHRDEAVDIVMSMAPHLDRKHQEQMLDVVANYVRQVGPIFAMDRDVWLSIADLLQQQGLLEQAPTIDEVVHFEIAEADDN